MYIHIGVDIREVDAAGRDDYEGQKGQTEAWRGHRDTMKTVTWSVPETFLFLLSEVEVSLDHLPDVFGLFVRETRQIQLALHDTERRPDVPLQTWRLKLKSFNMATSGLSISYKALGKMRVIFWGWNISRKRVDSHLRRQSKSIDCSTSTKIKGQRT